MARRGHRCAINRGEALLPYTEGVPGYRRGPEQFDENRLLGGSPAASGASAGRLVATVRGGVQRFP